MFSCNSFQINQFMIELFIFKKSPKVNHVDVIMKKKTQIIYILKTFCLFLSLLYFLSLAYSRLFTDIHTVAENMSLSTKHTLQSITIPTTITFSTTTTAPTSTITTATAATNLSQCTQHTKSTQYTAAHIADITTSKRDTNLLNIR